MKTKKQQQNDTLRAREAILRKKEYNLNPNKCLFCKRDILVEESVKAKLADIKIKKFCSRSCAARYNNKKFPKRSIFLGDGKYKLKGICSCGNKKDYESDLCHSCYMIKKYKDAKSKPLKYFFSKGNARIKYGTIRKWAALIIEKEGILKTCAVCKNKEFDSVVEVAHLKGIASFPEETLMGEVNNLDNLVYLCPSHHKLYDKGFMDKENILKLYRRQ